jgi:hypothetical protein
MSLFPYKNMKAYQLKVIRYLYPKDNHEYSVVVIAGELREAVDILAGQLLENKIGAAISEEIVEVKELSDNIIIQEEYKHE